MFGDFSQPITPAVANMSLSSGQLPASVIKDVQMLPRAMAVAARIGQEQFYPTSLVRDLRIQSHFVSRMIIPHHEPQKLSREERRRTKDLIRGVRVTKTESSNNSSDKPKDQ